MMFEEYLNYNEFEINKIVLYENNREQFTQLITQALEHYKAQLDEKARAAEKDKQVYAWEVPVERIYNEKYKELEMPAHALEPFYEYEKASTPEVRFAEFLEANKAHLEWWYKNGESAKEHFAVPYTDYLGKESLFYVDFVIRTKSGVRCLFDTKSEGSDPANAPRKHNALIDYVGKMNEKGIPTIGGIIVPTKKAGELMWRFSKIEIENTVDKDGWDFLNFQEIN